MAEIVYNYTAILMVFNIISPENWDRYEFSINKMILKAKLQSCEQLMII